MTCSVNNYFIFKMNFEVCALLTVLLVSCCLLVSSKNEENTLQQVHVLFRHGDKTPEKVGIYPTDPYFNETFWHPYGFGSLTNKGKMQAYDIGRALRRRYNNFLGRVYSPDKMYARSTNYDRTKMSLQLVLAGLWPPTSLQLWNALLPWQPIPYEYEAMDRDTLLKFPLSYCAKYQQEYKKALNSEEVRNFLKENSQTIDYINKNTGLNCTTTLDLVVLYFVLYAEEQYKLKLPDWTKKVYPEFLEKATSLEYEIQTFTDEMLQAGGGSLVQKVIHDARTKMRNSPRAKNKNLFLYSGHEFNLVQLLASLKLYAGQIPPYASYIIIELHKINNQYGFKVYYQDYSQSEPRLLTIPGCEQFCDFQRFFNIVFNVLPKDDAC